MFSWFFTDNMPLIVLVMSLILMGACILIIYSRRNKYLSASIKIPKIKIGGNGVKSVTGDTELDKAIETAGYAYDQKQDIFYSAGPDLNIRGLFNGTFYNCAKDIELVITLKDEKMRNAFLKGLKECGYLKEEIIVRGNAVGLKFNKPHTSQPISRTKETDWLVQRKNRLLCDKYQDVTENFNDLPDKIKEIHEKAPDIYARIIKIGNNEHLYRIHEKIKDYLT